MMTPMVASGLPRFKNGREIWHFRRLVHLFIDEGISDFSIAVKTRSQRLVSTASVQHSQRK